MRTRRAERLGVVLGGAVSLLAACGEQTETGGEPSKVEQTREVRRAAALNLLSNPGFEKGEITVKSWYQGSPVAGVEYLWDKGVAHKGRASLSLRKTAQKFFPVAQWFQTVDHDGTHRVLRVKAQVRAHNVTKAIIDAIFLDGQGEWISHDWVSYIGARNAGDPPANHDWREYDGKVDVPVDTKKIKIGLQIYGPGRVWFDDVVASYAD